MSPKFRIGPEDIYDTVHKVFLQTRLPLMKPKSSRSRGAFTLIELLVVIAIIAVLAGILLPVMSTVMKHADSSKCVSNLRQIGMAINSYSGDHAEALPGPLTLAQLPTYNSSSSKGSLPMLLTSYLSIPDGANGGGSSVAANKANVFVCPAYLKQFPKIDGAVYAMNMRQMTSYGQAPWGNSDASGDQQPVRKGVLGTWTENLGGDERPVDLSRTFAMRDTDAQDAQYGGATPSASYSLGKTPFHGDHRNTLFFDFHVAEMPLTDETPSWDPVTGAVNGS